MILAAGRALVVGFVIVAVVAVVGSVVVEARDRRHQREVARFIGDTTPTPDRLAIPERSRAAVRRAGADGGVRAVR